jgi:hypothetical protein
MKITQITVETGTTIPHPRYQYSSIRESVGATATIGPKDNPHVAVAELQEWLGVTVALRLEQRLKEDL